MKNWITRHFQALTLIGLSGFVIWQSERFAQFEEAVSKRDKAPVTVRFDNATTEANNLSASEFNRLRNELTALRRDVKKLQVRPDTNASSSLTQNDAGDDRPMTITPEVFEAFERQQQEKVIQAREQVARWTEQWEERLRSEVKDENWSDATSTLIRTAFSRDGLKDVSLTDTSCRQSLCRVEVRFSDPAEQARFELEFPGAVAEATPNIAKAPSDETEPLKAVYYLIRTGVEVPPIAGIQ